MSEQQSPQPDPQPDPPQEPAQPAQEPSTAAPAPAPADLDVIDLDAERALRAAQREGKRKPVPIRVGGETIAVLPVELPLDVIEPLRSLDSDITLVLRYAVQAYQGQGQQRMDAAETVVDLLASNPNLPVNVLDAITMIARNLLGNEGFEKFKASRPSGNDIVALAKGVLRFYGVSLGESLPPSDSSTPAGEISNTTSEPTSASTPETSGPTPTTPVTSASAAS